MESSFKDGPDVILGAYAAAAATFSAFSADGRKLRSLTNRMTTGLELRDSTWPIVHGHSSLPIDVETGRGTLGRRPR